MTTKIATTNPTRGTKTALAIGVVGPTIAAGTGLALVLNGLGSLPDPAAIHWGGSGKPDGFGSPMAFVWILVIAGWALPLLLSLSTVPTLKRGTYHSNIRFMIAGSVWMSVLISTILAISVYLQRGLTDAAQAPSVIPALVIGLLSATACGFLAWLILPRPTAAPAPGIAVAPLTLAPHERAVWAGTARTSPWITVPVSAAIAAFAVASILTASADSPTALVLLGVSIALIALLVVFGSFRVTVGEKGVIVRAYFGKPSIAVTLPDIESAQVTSVSPLADWGGYGWRAKPAGTGIVTRSGQALRVVKTNGKELVVTVDEAHLAAATLQALVSRTKDVSA